MTNISNHTKEALNAVIDFAYHNPHGSLYKKFWESHGFSTLPRITESEDFAKLPLISKQDLQGYSLSDRTFVPHNKIISWCSTSGTTGSGPLYFGRCTSFKHYLQRIHQDGAQKIAFVWAHELCISEAIPIKFNVGLQSIVADARNLPLSAHMIAEAKVDALFICPSVLLRLAPHLEKYHWIEQIRYIIILGEFYSDQTLQSIQSTYPNARIYANYSLSESSHSSSIRTPECSTQSANYYHVEEDGIYFELVDGELVITTLEIPHAMPLIRYRTGDQAEWIPYDECVCGHKGPSFRILGRSNVDFVRIGGFELRQHAIEEVLSSFKSQIEPYISCEVREHMQNNLPIFVLNISVVPKNNKENLPKLVDEIQHALLKKLRVSATSLLDDIVKKNIMTIPTITFLKSVPSGHKKPGIKLINQ